MASNTTDDLLFSATAAHSRANDFAGTQTIFYSEVVETILEAVDDGAFTVTISASGQSSQDIQWVIEELRHNGYTVTTSTTNIVVSW
jgi:D-arabinose 5-phosphate isomerase GutQ